MAKSGGQGYAPKLKKPATLDHLRKKEPVEKLVPIVLSDRPIRAVEEVRKDVVRAERAADADPKNEDLQQALAAAKVALEDVLEASEDETVWLTFRSIGRKRYEKIVGEHPPTDEQKKKAAESNAAALWNDETFSPALVSASCADPEMTVEEATEFFDEWNGSEWSELYLTALAVNTGRRVSDLGNASGGMTG